MDRASWGSDQAASLEPNGITRLVRDIRLWELSKGDGTKRVYEREVPIIKKLRGSAPGYSRGWLKKAGERSPGPNPGSRIRFLMVSSGWRGYGGDPAGRVETVCFADIMGVPCTPVWTR
jgi:hypothetical protein